MAKSETARYELRILGAPDLRAPDGRRVASILSQPSRLGLLAYLTLAPRPVTRASVVAAFWPESDEARARNALSQAVFYLRRSLGRDVVQGLEADRLWVSPDDVWCDARELLTEDRPSDEVVRAASDEALAGWNADTSQPLQEWLDTLRRRVRERAAELAGELADGGAREGAAPGRPPSAPGAPRENETTTSGPVPERSPRRLGPVGATLSAVAVAAVALAVAALAVLGPDPAPFGSDAEARLVVLLPRVTVSPGAPEMSGLTLNAELLARLPQREGLEVVSAASASSLQELRSQLEAIGMSGRDAPAWILDVSVVLTDSAAHVVGLLYDGAGLGVPGRDSFDEEFTEPGELAVDVPRAIAERVGAMVGGVVAR